MNSINFKVLSDTKEVPDAKEAHINYLLDGPHVLTDEGAIVHSLSIDKDDLEKLALHGKDGGMRLYFCREKNTASPANPFLSIICVPVDSMGENVLEETIFDAAGNPKQVSLLINNLEPCPDKCSLDGISLKDLNYKKNTNNVDVWCKPNLRTLLHRKNWFDAQDKVVE